MADAQHANPHCLISRQLSRPFAARNYDGGIAVRRVRLTAEGDRAALDYGLQFRQAVGGRFKDALVAIDFLRGLAKARIRHCERQVHVAFLEGAIVGEGVCVLRIATQNDFVLFGRRY